MLQVFFYVCFLDRSARQVKEVQWTSEQIEHYFRNPQFFDTALIPVYRAALDRDQIELVRENEEKMIRLIEIEQRLKGRVILLPAVVLYGTSSVYVQAYIEQVSKSLGDIANKIFIPFDDVVFEQLQNSVHGSSNIVLSVDNLLWYEEIMNRWRSN